MPTIFHRNKDWPYYSIYNIETETKENLLAPLGGLLTLLNLITVHSY